MKKLTILLLVLALQLFTPSLISAQANGASKETHGAAKGEIGDKVGGAASAALNDPTIDPLKGKFADLGSITSSLLPYLLTFAGLILFAMLIMGGFTIMTATTDPKKAEAGKERITTAIIGFVIIFAAYWIAQILEIIFGVKILGS